MKITKRKIFFLICIVISVILIRYLYYEIIADNTSNKLYKFSQKINKCIQLSVKHEKFSNYCYSNIFSIKNMNITTSHKEILKILENTIGTNYFYKNKYTFSPVTPAGEAIISMVAMDEKSRDKYYKLPFVEPRARYWMWGRVRKDLYIFRPLFGRNNMHLDKNISWYYQCPIDCLKPEELVKEKEYRKKKGLPELKKN